MEKNRSKRHIALFVVIAVAVSWFVLAIVGYMANMKSIQRQATNRDLATVADGNANQVDFMMEQYIKTLTAVVTSVQAYDDLTSPEVLAILDEIAHDDIFERLAIDFADGTSYTSDGGVFDISFLGYADRIREGKPFVLDVVDAIKDGTPVVSALVPIESRNGRYRAALRGSISTERMTALFDRTFALYGGYYHVVDGNGRYVSTGSSNNSLLMEENFFDALNKLKFQEGYSAQQIQEAFVKHQKGFTRYALGEEARYVYYTPVGINDWMLFMILPMDVAEQTANLNMLNALLLTMQVVAIMLLLILYVYFTQKRARELAQTSEKCFTVLAEQTNKAIFEWNFDRNEISFLSNFDKMFGKEGKAFAVPDEMIEAGVVHEEDRAAIEELFLSVKHGQRVSNVRLRLANGEDAFQWCEISIAFVASQSGKLLRAVGFIEDIDERVKKEERLRRMSETDQLTGLNNKITTEYRIETVLMASEPQEDHHALLIVDIDNYKDVNDCFGHWYGDMVLAQLAAVLRAVFRESDILGRLGGDEFFVLLRDVGSLKVIEQKAKEICSGFRKTYSEQGKSVQISASVGVALYPRDGITFEQLYQNADAALYNVKANGKDGQQIYDGARMQGYSSGRTDIDAYGEKQKSFLGNKAEYIFKMLYGSEDERGAVQSALRFIAEFYGFSRVNIYESDKASRLVSETFEWCADGVALTMPEQQHLPVEQFAHIKQEFAKQGGMFAISVKDFPEHTHASYMRADILSVIYFAIMDAERLAGAITFQDCANERITLSESEMSEFRTICEVIGTFLVKVRAAERKEEHHFALKTVIENIDGYVYVVDPQTHEILFENQQVRDWIGRSSVGKKCYEVYMQCDSPCDTCAMLDVGVEEKKCTVEVESQARGLCMRTTAALIEWLDGRNVCLINSIDITEYKQNKQ